MKRLNYALSCLTALFVMAGLVGLNAQDITHPSSGTANFTVDEGTSVMYYDDGGPDCDGTGEEYSNNTNSTAVICPDAFGSVITIEFLDVDVEIRTTSPCWDYIRVYDGNSTGANLLFEGCGEEGFDNCSGFPGDGGDGGGNEGGPNDIDGSNDATPVNNVFTSTAANGCLTVNFDSDGSVQEGGWVAQVTASDAGGGGPTCFDGIQNGNETGVDCGGSCPPCGGGGPTCSDGIQNGNETGVDCGGSCPPCEAECDAEYALTIDLDNFPSETSWELTNINGTTAGSGGPYSSGDDPVEEDFCLDYGCYEFTIFDSFGDGICCGFGFGSYMLEDNDGNVVGGGGDFGSAETTLFCTDPGPDCEAPTATASVIDYCANGVFMVAVTLSDVGSANTLVIANNGGVPALQNVFFPRTYYVGPFEIGETVDIWIFDTENSACITMLTDISSDCGFFAPEGPTTGGETFSGVNVFPNPTTGEVNVSMLSFMGKNTNIRIVNAVGQLIEHRQIDEVQDATERFNLADQQSGIYFIHIDVEGADSYVERVVVGNTRP